MPKIGLLLAALMLVIATEANAWWGGDRWDDGWNDWPVWTPMYWMEEMEDEWDDDYYGPYRYGPYGYPGYGYGGYPYGGYGYPGNGYGGQPYGGYGYPGYGYGGQPYYRGW